MAIAPLDINEESEDYWESWPTHLAVVHDDFEFRIMRVAAYKKVFKESQRMTAIEAAIRTHGKGADVEKLPYPVYRGGGLNFWTQPEFVEGDGWRGLRWIGGYAQDSACGPDVGGQELGYYFEGTSNDGQFFILLRSHISSAALAQLFGKDCHQASSEGGVNAVFQKDVRAMSAASFQPNLDQLDAVVRSLKLR